MPQIRSGRRTFAPLLFLATLLLTTPDEARTAPPTATSAASATDPRFDAALARADSLLRARSADAASAILDSLIERAGTTDNDEAALRVHLARARLNGLVGRPRLGRESASAALELASAWHDTAFVCQALRWLAVAAQQEGSMLEARTHAARLLDLARGRGDRFHQGQGFLLMAYSDRVTGERDAAEGEYLEAVRIFVELDQPVFELMAHQGLAQIYLGHGDIDGARRSDLRVLEGSRRIGDPYGEARALNDLGVLEFTYGDPSTAAGYYTSAFELQVRMGDVPGSVTSAKNLAVLHTYMGEFDEAMRVLEDALARCEAAGLRSQEAAVLEQMAIVRREEGIHAKAVELFRRATERTPGDTPDPLAGILTGLARTLSMRDSTEAGIALMLDRIEPMRDRLSPLTAYNAERTLGDLMLLEDRFAEALERLERAESIARPRGFGFLVGVLALQARCHSRLNHPDSARACLDRAVASWESERGRMRDPIWREQLELDGRLLFTEILRRTLADTVLGSEHERAGRAFESLQRFKTRTLIERMLGSFSEGADSEDPTGPADSAAPRAGAFKRLRGGVQLDGFQDRWLGEDEILLDFFQASTGVYLFGVTRTDCRAAWIPFDRDTLATVLRRYRQLASTKPGDASTGAGDAPQAGRALLEAAGFRLSNSFLSEMADLLATHERILLAPDGAFQLVPIELWPAPSAAGGSHEPPGATPAAPLIDHWKISRVPSAAVLEDCRSRSASVPALDRPAVILAVTGKARPGRADLSWASKETAWLVRSFRGARARSISGSEDSPAWSPELDRCDVLHLAAHVTVDDAHPWRSGLPGLRAQEIAKRRLSARLAVLAGCESAGGRVVSGEGVLGLTSALEVAGLPTVVATLWPVSDRVTWTLTRSFYSALAAGRSAGDALRLAQNTVRADPRTSHPFYWAGFVLIGEAETRIPLQHKGPRPALLASIAALAAALAVAGYLGHRYRSRRCDSDAGGDS